MSSLKRRAFLKCSAIALSAAGLPVAGIASVLPAPASAAGDTHRVLGCNIRVALPEDDQAGQGWAARKKSCLTVIKNQKPDLIGFQEVLKVQADDLKQAMPDYGCFGFEGPEMDINPDTYNGIAKNLVMYSKKRYELISAGCYWLSETPEMAGSLSWNTARARHVNWLRLADKRTGIHFRIMAVHLDHKDQGARNKQGELVVKESNQYSQDFPQLLIGDFNVTALNPVYKIITDGGWSDSHTTVHGPGEPGPTYHNFLGKEYKIPAGKSVGKIDFIFTRGRFKAVKAEIVKDMADGRYPSDHFFVRADVVLT